MPFPIGKTYDGGAFTVSQRDALAYAEATDDPHPAYRGDDAVAPPMFHVRPFIPLMLGMARDPELGIDMLRLVHGEHRMTFSAPLRDGDVLGLTGVLADVAEKRSGTVYTFALHGDRDGERVLDGATSYFVRAPKKPDAAPKPRRDPPPAPPAPSWSREQPVTEDQAIRYAAASGDDNAIHTDPEVARKAGLPGCILHGLCTMAFAQRDLLGDRDPGRLASIGVRFTGMVLPGQTLRLDVWEDGDARTFTTYGPSGKPVLTGRAAFRA